MNDLLMRRLRFVVSPTRFYPPHLEADMTMAYRCWKNVWREAFLEEMNLKEKLYSDNFIRQSHVAVLFLGDEPFALTTLNEMNLDKIIYRDDSFFRTWSPEALTDLRSHSRNILACCNVTLNFQFRKKSQGISGKDLMLAMLVQYLKHNPFDSIVAAVRIEKGMDKASYRTGAIALSRNVPYSIPGQRVDLVCWRKDLDLSGLDPDIRLISDYVWKNSTNTFQGELYAA